MRAKRQALFVMAKDPRAGQVKTRLCPPLTPETAARLYQCFLSDTLDLAAGVPGVDPIVAYSPHGAREAFARLVSERFQLIAQTGEDLGARLENTFRELFRQGYDHVAAVSTDSPDLPPEYVQEAFTGLDEAPVVLGPCPDGGYYLIGLSTLIPGLFRDMPWSTERVAPETEARARSVGAGILRLPEWYDVDTATDLDRLIRNLAGDRYPSTRAPRTSRFCQRELGGRPLVADRPDGLPRIG
jgi:rSAM/selenodomain-associated transferase 1